MYISDKGYLSNATLSGWIAGACAIYDPSHSDTPLEEHLTNTQITERSLNALEG